MPDRMSPERATGGRIVVEWVVGCFGIGGQITVVCEPCGGVDRNVRQVTGDIRRTSRPPCEGVDRNISTYQ